MGRSNQHVGFGLSFLLVVLYPLLFSTSVYSMVWWPEVEGVSTAVSIYEDFQDKNQYYYIPKSIHVAEDRLNRKMITHGLFMDSENRENSLSIYNITLVPELDTQAVRQARSDLKRLFGDQVKLSPMPVTTVDFSFTQNSRMGEFIEVQLPQWKGDIHSIEQEFSIAISAPAFKAEPGLSRMLSSDGGNAIVGTFHFGVMSVNRPLDIQATVDFKAFRSQINEFMGAGMEFMAKAQLDRTLETLRGHPSIKIEGVREEEYTSELWDRLEEFLIAKLFEEVPSPEDLDNEIPDTQVFRIATEYAEIDQDFVIKLDLSEALIRERAGDIDFAAGGIPMDQLDPRLRYFCDPFFEQFDQGRGKCVALPQPKFD